MEQRKLIQHGISSLTVSLPIKWLKERGLKKGDSLYVNIEGNKLVLSTAKSLKIEKISVDVTKLDRTSILLYIQSLYRFGYNEIEVKFSKPTTIHYRKNERVSISSIVHLIVNRLIGIEIVEQTSNRILIKYITKEAEEDFKVILRRAFLLLKETANNLLEGIRNNDMDLVRTIEEYHDNITKFISYCLRLLNKYGYPDVKKTSFFYHIIATIDKIVDILKYNARDILKYKGKFNKDTIIIWEHINNSIIKYYQLFYNFDFSFVDELSKNRDFVKNLIREKMKKIPQEELMYLTNMKQILEIILDLTEFRMGLEY
jgi:phosphate uptake regulator